MEINYEDISSPGQIILIRVTQPAGLLICKLPLLLQIGGPQCSPSRGGHQEEHGKGRNKLEDQSDRTEAGGINDDIAMHGRVTYVVYCSCRRFTKAFRSCFV